MCQDIGEFHTRQYWHILSLFCQGQCKISHKLVLTCPDRVIAEFHVRWYWPVLSLSWLVCC